MQKDILYTFRRCPYAIRARWAILIAGIHVTCREVSLKEKPEHMLELSPKGTVPVLLLSNGYIIQESLEIMKWAIQSTDKLETFRLTNKKYVNEIEDIINQNDQQFKRHLDKVKYSSRSENNKDSSHQKNARSILLEWNRRIEKSLIKYNQRWLVGNQESLADWAIWPFVRQYKMADKDFFDSVENEPIRSWLNYYLMHPLFDILMKKYVSWSPGDITQLYPDLPINY